MVTTVSESDSSAEVGTSSAVSKVASNAQEPHCFNSGYVATIVPLLVTQDNQERLESSRGCRQGTRGQNSLGTVLESAALQDGTGTCQSVSPISVAEEE